MREITDGRDDGPMPARRRSHAYPSYKFSSCIPSIYQWLSLSLFVACSLLIDQRGSRERAVSSAFYYSDFNFVLTVSISISAAYWYAERSRVHCRNDSRHQGKRCFVCSACICTVAAYESWIVYRMVVVRRTPRSKMFRTGVQCCPR